MNKTFMGAVTVDIDPPDVEPFKYVKTPEGDVHIVRAPWGMEVRCRPGESPQECERRMRNYAIAGLGIAALGAVVLVRRRRRK